MTATATPAIGASVPLLFTYRDCLFGNGFVVEVKVVNGRALCVQESDGFWMYGVNPGAMAASGDDASEAHTEFRQLFSSLLKDLAQEANSFEEFHGLVLEFFNDTNPGYEREWLKAVQAVRRAKIDIEGVPRAPADSPREVHVSMKEHFSATDNNADLELARAA